MLLGNKADLIATGDQPRAVKTVDGESLARVSYPYRTLNFHAHDVFDVVLVTDVIAH